MEKYLILEKNNDLVKTFNDFFTSAVSNSNNPRYQDPFTDSDQTENQVEHPILRILEQYKNLPSMIAINNQNMDRRLSFQEIKKSEINQEILNLDSSKACQESDLPTMIIKVNSDIFTEVIHKELNRGLEVGSFSCTMKQANVTPVYKKDNRSEKGNYRPVSILPNISKVFERCIYKQMSQFFEEIISKYQCGFRKGHSAQHALISVLEKWRYGFDQGRMFGALLTELSKDFDCLPYDVITVKLNAYGFDMKALNFIYDYLRNRKQRTNKNNANSSWQNILYGVSKGSILGPLLFNIDLCDFFFIMNHEDIANYADDNTPYDSGKNMVEVARFLEESSCIIFKWFSYNQFQANASKCHVLLSTDEHVQVKIGTAQIENSSSKRLPDVTIYAKLSFVKHIEQIYAKARA